MKRMRWMLFALCTLFATHAAALDPLSLLVLRMIRDRVITSQLESALSPEEAREAAHTMVRQYPGDVRGLVDQGFPYLDRDQRSAIQARLMEMMNDPRHAADRDAILEEFVAAASASRQAHEALSRLSYAEKKSIAVRTAELYRGKPREEMEEIVGMLQSPAVPIPSDLRELMLAELAAESGRTVSR